MHFEEWKTESRRSPSTRRPWAERGEPKERNLGFDTAAYRARYPDKSESPEPEVKRGLEPIYDSNDCEVLNPRHPHSTQGRPSVPKFAVTSSYAASPGREVQGGIYG